MKELTTTRGNLLLDDDVYEFLKDKKVDFDSKGYPLVRLHQMFFKNRQKGQIIDHADGDIKNCQRVNLRVACSVGNSANARPSTKRKNKKSKYKGVSVDRRPNRADRWYIRVCPRVKGHPTARHRLFFKEFKTEIEAARAYDLCALFLWGEFAYTNFDKSSYNGLNLSKEVAPFRVGSSFKKWSPVNIKIDNQTYVGVGVVS